jgi:Mg-chelatase subunit ChlI
LIDQLNFGKKKKMTMVKQRRSFFVDDILHMVMPVNKNTNYSDEIHDRKRKRSIIPEDDNSIEEDSSNKKFRSYNHEDKDDDEESKHSQLGDDDTGEVSSISDNSNSVGNNSGKLRHIFDKWLELKYVSYIIIHLFRW